MSCQKYPFHKKHVKGYKSVSKRIAISLGFGFRQHLLRGQVIVVLAVTTKPKPPWLEGFGCFLKDRHMRFGASGF